MSMRLFVIKSQEWQVLYYSGLFLHSISNNPACQPLAPLSNNIIDDNSFYVTLLTYGMYLMYFFTLNSVCFHAALTENITTVYRKWTNITKTFSSVMFLP